MFRLTIAAGCAAGILALSSIGAVAAPVSAAAGTGIQSSSNVELAGHRRGHRHKVIIIKKTHHHHHRRHHHHRKHRH